MDEDKDEEDDANANILPDLEYVHSPRLPADRFYDSIDLVSNNTPSDVHYAED